PSSSPCPTDRQVSASKFLDSFLFPPEKQYNFVGKLSGGEKKRLQLLKMLVTNPNFLILDEPTNDFDIDTLNVLEDFLEKFTGCLLLVSHDRYFMDHLVDQLFVFEGDGKIRQFNGNYSDYREWVEENESTPTVAAVPVAVRHTAEPQKKKASFKEKQEYERLQSEIEALEKKKDDLTEQFNSGITDHVALQTLSTDIQTVASALDEKTMRWLELSDLIAAG
ncbi:MAG: ABC-F family ATP-binding cassette domain-containing protein, partial [Bacteroidia bacterium]|nr:ABC-F family ATP-binding cassette domain-containing protein [Bacteroidia bacterium]